MQGTIQHLLFIDSQRSKGAFREFPQRERPDRHAHQPEHVYSQCLQHAPNLAILAFGQNDFKPTVFMARAQQADVTGAQGFGVARLLNGLLAGTRAGMPCSRCPCCEEHGGW